MFTADNKIQTAHNMTKQTAHTKRRVQNKKWMSSCARYISKRDICTCEFPIARQTGACLLRPYIRQTANVHCNSHAWPNKTFYYLSSIEFSFY